jgi:hypothetical protein
MRPGGSAASGQLYRTSPLILCLFPFVFIKWNIVCLLKIPISFGAIIHYRLIETQADDFQNRFIKSFAPSFGGVLGHTFSICQLLPQLYLVSTPDSLNLFVFICVWSGSEYFEICKI